MLMWQPFWSSIMLVVCVMITFSAIHNDPLYVTSSKSCVSFVSIQLIDFPWIVNLWIICWIQGDIQISFELLVFKVILHIIRPWIRDISSISLKSLALRYSYTLSDFGEVPNSLGDVWKKTFIFVYWSLHPQKMVSFEWKYSVLSSFDLWFALSHLLGTPSFWTSALTPCSNRCIGKN